MTHRGGPLVVVGGAGTGKTSIIAERFGWLVEEGSRPERIAVLVPSEARADALRERLDHQPEFKAPAEEPAGGTPQKKEGRRTPPGR